MSTNQTYTTGFQDDYLTWLTDSCDQTLPLIEHKTPKIIDISKVSYLEAAQSTKEKTQEHTIINTSPNKTVVSALTVPSIQDMIAEALDQQQTEHNQQMISMNEDIQKLQKQMENFKADAIGQIVDNLTKRETFVSQAKFATFETNINIAIQKLPTLNDIKEIFTQATAPPTPTRSPQRKHRRLDSNTPTDTSSPMIEDEQMMNPPDISDTTNN